MPITETIKKGQIKRKVDSSNVEILRPETEAELVIYDNSTSDLDAQNVQAAIDEVAAAIAGAGKVDDVRINNNSIVSNKVADIHVATVTAPYGSDNKLTTQSYVADEINSALETLDGNITGTPGAGKTLTAFSETDGVVSATFGNISITSSQVSDIQDTYSGTDGKAISGKGVKAALETLDGSISGTPGAGKTLTAFSETDGIVSATFGNISITSSQISDKTNSYSSTGTVAVTGTAIADALGTLDVSNISGFGVGKTLATLTETDGKIAATFQDISITESQISDLGDYVPTSRTIAGVDLQDNITSAELAQALGITGAMSFVGISTTDPTGSSGATVSGHTSWKKGEVVLYQRSGETGYEEYIATADDNAHWELLGDADSYALKSVTVTGTGVLSGGGDLSQNRTITHNQVNTSGAQSTAKVWKQKLDAYGHVTEATAATAADVGVSLTTTAGSEAITVGSSSLNVVTRDTAQTITGKKTFKHADGIVISDPTGNANFNIKATYDGEFLYKTLHIGGGSDTFIDINSTIMRMDSGTFDAERIDTHYLMTGQGESTPYLWVYAPAIWKTKKDGESGAADATYGFQFPDTRGWSANKMLATTDQIPSVTNFVEKTGDTMTGWLNLNAGSGYTTSPGITFSTSTGLASLGKINSKLTYQNTDSGGSANITFPNKTGELVVDSDISGFVTGPATNTDNAVAVWDRANSKTLKNSNISISGTEITTNGNNAAISLRGSMSVNLYTGSTGSSGASLGNAAAGVYAFMPTEASKWDLGCKTSTLDRRWKDLYLSGNLSDGTNSTTIANIISGLTTNVNSGKKANGSTDITGSKSGTVITLGDSGITAGTYSAVQVNAKGIAVAGGQILDVIAHGGTPNVVNGGWYFEEVATA